MRKISRLCCTVLLSGSLLLSPAVVNADQDSLIDAANQMMDLRQSGKYAECLTLADQLLAKDMLIMEAHRNKALCYFELEKPREALDTLKGQLLLNPRNYQALYNAACASAVLGEKAEAIKYLKQLFALDITSKMEARQDPDFAKLKNTPEFQKIAQISVRVGGDLLDFDVQPLVLEGRTMVPMRAIFEALGAQVSWDNQTSTVTATKDNISIVLTINNKVATRNGTSTNLDVAPILKDGRTLVPVRFISEALGANVKWEAENELVEILTAKPMGKTQDYNAVKQELDKLVITSVVDGMMVEPYGLEVTEGMTMIIAKDKKALELMESLDEAARIKYMYDTTYANFAMVLGCKPVHMKFIYDGEVYFSGDMYYEKKGEGISLDYYAKGLPINVIKQYNKKCDYKDFYQLPLVEQTNSTLED